MKFKYHFAFCLIYFLVTFLHAQDSVDVTFRFKNNQQSFLVGEFNDWNNSVWPMSFNGTEWVRTARLPIGGNPNPPVNGVPGAWQYKFFFSGASPWPNDPLNHHVNLNDNSNTYVSIKDPTIYHFLPNFRLGALDDNVVTISAYIFPKVGSIVDTSAITLNVNGTIYDNLGSNYNFETKQLNFTPLAPFSDGSYTVILDVGTNADTANFSVVTSDVQLQPLPTYANHGVTLPSPASNDSTTFRLRVGSTNYVLLRVAPENLSAASAPLIPMRKDISSSNWWINLKLEPGTYKYLYETDSGNSINDPWGKWTANDGASLFTIGPAGLIADDYEWQSNDYEKPPLNRLIIYELHVGEFGGGFYSLPGGEAGFPDLITLLPYLDSLGVNAIELMPVNDFGTLGKSGHSWGYDLNSYFALEPSYGTPAEFKALVDSAHARGIAVILDVVFNHLNDTGSLWQMLPNAVPNPYFKENNDFRPNEDALFFFRDMDHWNAETQELIYAVLKMWIDEYRIDGFRYDFTQGIGWDVDQPGKGILGWVNRIRDDYSNSIYQIAEHLPESPALIFRSGMTSGWHDSYHDFVFNEARFNNIGLAEFEDFILGLHASRSNDNPSIPSRYGNRTEPVNMNVNHDEQSLIYEMTNFQGIALDEAIKRDKLYATLTFTSLGIPLVWQGMEFSESRGWRNEGEKLSYRPVNWSLLDTQRGEEHFDYYRALIRQRLENPALYQGELKKLQRYDSEKILVWGFDDSTSTDQVMVIANFKSVEQTVENVQWLGTGDWFNIFDQSVFYVAQIPIPSLTIPGYSALVFASSPDSTLVSVATTDGRTIPLTFQLFQNYPNPFNPETTIEFNLPDAAEVKIAVYNITGQKIKTLSDEFLNAGNYTINWNGLDDKNLDTASGLYFVEMRSRGYSKSIKIIKLK